MKISFQEFQFLINCAKSNPDLVKNHIDANVYRNLKKYIEELEIAADVLKEIGDIERHERLLKQISELNEGVKLYEAC